MVSHTYGITIPPRGKGVLCKTRSSSVSTFQSLRLKRFKQQPSGTGDQFQATFG